METNIEEMYTNLNELLHDICKFLNNYKLRELSPKDHKLAEALINRCKVQLQEISKVQQTPPNDEYVDMNSKQDDNVQVPTILIEDEPVCPYKDLPAKEASTKVKYGCISMRRKFLLGFEKMRKIYAFLHNRWLLVYCSERDTKPIMTFDLRNYEAKADNDERNRSTNFELVSIMSHKKIHSFMALTPKDMLQWVTQINRCRDSVTLNEDDEVGDHYDSVIPPNNYKPVENQEENEDEGEGIYSELDVVQPNRQNNNIASLKKKPEGNFDHRPALPGRRPFIRNLSIPVAPPTVKPLPLPQEESDDDASLVSYDDIQIKDDQENQSPKVVSGCLGNSFSEDEEDMKYEAFVDVQGAVNKLRVEKSEPKNVKTDIKDQSPQPEDAVVTLPISPKVKERPPVAKKPVAILFGSFKN